MTKEQLKEVSDFIQSDEENYGIFAVMLHGAIHRTCLHVVDILQKNKEDRGYSAVLIAACNVLALETMVTAIIHEPHFVDGKMTDGWKTLCFNSLKNMSKSFSTFLDLIDLFPELKIKEFIQNLMKELFEKSSEGEESDKIFDPGTINKLWNV